MSKSSVRPLIAGGRTLSRLGRKPGSGHGKTHKKRSWYQLDGRVFGEQAHLSSWPVGELPFEIEQRIFKR